MDGLDEIRNIIESGDIEEALKGGSSYGALMNLSDIRANLISWIPFDAIRGSGSYTCLELNAGCGPVTGYLCSIFDHVTAVCSAEEEADINRLRNIRKEGHDNLDVISGDISAAEGKTFDVIVVTEGFAGFIRSGRMDAFRSFLKPGGLLIGAAENELSLSVLAGGGSGESERVTHSGITEAAENGGFKECLIYYPAPDMRLPMNIYSEGYLDDAGISGADLFRGSSLCPGASPAYQSDRYVFFDEHAAAERLAREGLLKKFAASFLIICSADKIPDKISAVRFIKFNSHRRPDFRVATGIISDGNESYAVKYAAGSRASGKVKDILENYNALKNAFLDIRPAECTPVYEGPGESDKLKSLRFEYIPGTPLDEYVWDQYEESGENDLNSLCGKLKEAIALITGYKEEPHDFEPSEGFDKLFGKAAGLNEKSDTEIFASLKDINLDSNLDNFIKTVDGTDLIDYEWCFPFDIPVRFVIFRAIHYFYEKWQGRLADEFGPVTDGEPLTERLLHSRLGITDREQKIYSAMEYSFQEYIHGENVSWIYTPNYEKEYIKVRSLEEKRRLEGLLKESLTKAIRYRRVIKSPGYAIKAREYAASDRWTDEIVSAAKSGRSLKAAADNIPRSMRPYIYEYALRHKTYKPDDATFTGELKKAGALPDIDSSIRCSVDKAFSAKDYIYISGWAFRSMEDDNDEEPVSIVLIPEDEGGVSYIISAGKVLRPDVDAAFPGEPGIRWCGFVAKAALGNIHRGSYRVLVTLGKGMAETGSRIDII